VNTLLFYTFTRHVGTWNWCFMSANNRVRTNLSNNNNEIEASTRDTRFVLKVQLTTKVAYAAIDHQDLVQFSTIKSPWRRGQYKLSKAHHNLGGPRWTPSPSRGEVMNAERLSVKCFAWRLSWSLKGWLQSLLGGLDLREAWRRESLSSRSFGSNCFQLNGVTNGVKGAWTSFYTP
jgi:hypothetical protein